jgi:hypothetical protein
MLIGATGRIGLEVDCVLTERGSSVGVAGRRVDRQAEMVRSIQTVKGHGHTEVTDEAAPHQEQGGYSRSGRYGSLFP